MSIVVRGVFVVFEVNSSAVRLFFEYVMVGIGLVLFSALRDALVLLMLVLVVMISCIDGTLVWLILV